MPRVAHVSTTIQAVAESFFQVSMWRNFGSAALVAGINSAGASCFEGDLPTILVYVCIYIYIILYYIILYIYVYVFIVL